MSVVSACNGHRVATVELLLEHKACPNTASVVRSQDPSPERTPALATAVQDAPVEIFHSLHSAGARFAAAEVDCLFATWQAGKVLSVIDCLIRCRADFCGAASHGFSALHRAAVEP